jgi:hypothetical protein
VKAEYSLNVEIIAELLFFAHRKQLQADESWARLALLKGYNKGKELPLSAKAVLQAVWQTLAACNCAKGSA